MATGSNTKTTLSLQLGEFPSLIADSLQTPDTSSLFLSAISNQPDTSLVFQDRTSTITSLEELLNVTGINQTEEINFSEIAREVEAQHGQKRSLSQEDTSISMNTSNGVISAKQPKMELNLSARLHSGHVELPASSLHQIGVTIEPSDNHRLFPVQTVAQHSQGCGTCTSVAERNPDHHLTSVSSMLKSSGRRTGQANGMSVVTLQSAKVESVSPNSSSTLLSFANTVNVSSPAGATNSTTTVPTAGASVPIAAGMSLKSLSQGNLVLQLVQLYRQYQQLGDTQGMAKVKQQLSTFLSTQNNNKAISSTSQPTYVPLLAPVKSHVVSTSTQLIGQPRSGAFLGSNPSVSAAFSPSISASNFQPLAPKPMLTSNLSHAGHKPSSSKPSSQTIAPMPTLPVNVSVTSIKTSSSISLPSTISGKGTDSSTMQFGQGRPDLIGQLVPSFLSSLSSSSNSITASSSPQSQDVLKTMYMYRVKQIQAFMQGLPADQKPRNLTELKDLLKRYNVNFQANDLVGSMSQLSSASSGLLSATSPTSLGPQGSPANATQLPSPPISVSQKVGISFPLLASSGQLPFSVKPSTTMSTPQPSTTLAKPANLNTSGTLASMMTSLPNPRVAVAPIQPGMVTPLPPGLNLEALAKLCSLPESELVKHNLPPSLLTAIKVWKQQQKSEPQSSLFKSVEATSTDIPVLMGKEDKIFTSGIGIPVARLNLPMVANRSATEPRRSNTGPSFSTAAVTMASLDKSSVTKTFADSKDHFTKALAGMTSVDPSNLNSHPSTTSLSGLVSTQISNMQQQTRGTFGLPTVSRADLDSITASLASRVTVGPLGDGNSPLLAHLSSLRTQRQGPSQLSGYQGVVASNSKSSISSQPAETAKLPASSIPTQSTLSPAAHSTGNRPMTRYQAKVEHARAEHERIQTIHKILHSSDEAKIAFRIQSHLEKMQSQVVTPDVHTPFKSFQDVLVRLLPYHILSEPEPAPGTMEKADAVVESVAQILMSRSRGLISRYQQLVLKDTQLEHDRPLCIILDRLFTEAEHERIAQENREKQQAEQIAADLSLIGSDNMMNFDNDFSFGDILNDDPMFSLDPGVT